MFDFYFLIYCMIQFYCAIQDGHHNGHVGHEWQQKILFTMYSLQQKNVLPTNSGRKIKIRQIGQITIPVDEFFTSVHVNVYGFYF